MADELSIPIVTEHNFIETVTTKSAKDWVAELIAFNNKFMQRVLPDQLWNQALAELRNDVDNALSNVQHELTERSIAEQPQRTAAIISKLFADRKLVSPSSPYGQELSHVFDRGQALAAHVAYAAYLKEPIFPLHQIQQNRSGLLSQVSYGLSIAGLYGAGAFVRKSEIQAKIDNLEAKVSKDFESLRKSQIKGLNDEIVQFRFRASQSLENWDTRIAEQQTKISSLLEHGEFLSKQRSEFDHWQSTTNEKISSEFQTREIELKRLQDTFRTGLVLEETYKYWKDRHKLHNSRAKIWGIALVIYAGGIIVLGSKFIPDLLVKLDKPIYQTPALVAAAIFGIVLIAIWGGRILTRSYLEKRFLAEDALERSTLVQTYIALIKEGGITPENADVVLRALFRVATAPSPAGDLSPSLPNDLFSKFVPK